MLRLPRRAHQGPVPRLLVKYAEAESAFVSWRWSDRLDRAGAARLGAEPLARIRALLDETLPEPIGEETAEAALERAMRRGHLADPARTAELGSALADALLPYELVEALRRPGVGTPRMRLQPSPSLARVPWALLRPRPERRPLVEWAVVEHGVPAAIAQTARMRGTSGEGDGVVAVIDPRVPGQAATSPLGSVLGRPRADDPLGALLEHGERLRPHAGSYPELARRTDLDRDWLRDACRDARRLLYVGHVTAPDLDVEGGAAAAMHLACTDAAGAHAPLPAAELVREGWRLPPRVALIACGSGTDLRAPEPMGLALAAVMAGAGIVTACGWTLPTDSGLAHGGAGLGERSPLRELVLAVDRAHEHDDPAAELGRWQARRAAEWEAHGHAADSPLLWAAPHTLVHSG